MVDENNQNDSQETQDSSEPEVVEMEPRLVQEGLDTENLGPEVVDMKPRLVLQDMLQDMMQTGPQETKAEKEKKD
ncbi:MAG: hypothetical protein JRI79_16285 [Deltaproteobacteria bacterium]|nr:hypothetical protein [Deltaproteobacteria bacterium]MBW1979499.1 hypothetical protein [Deltaproteobacteria bacterium]MBW2043941.1 hypothetical protein [Deltaproteobacteria bacterium]